MKFLIPQNIFFCSLLPKRCLFLCFLFTYCFTYSQTKTIVVSGKASSESKEDVLTYVMVINKRTYTGTMADPDGSFRITALKSDTIIISSYGYVFKKICFNDSVSKDEYHIEVKLSKPVYELKEVDIHPVKKMGEVDEERKEVGTGLKPEKKATDYISTPLGGPATISLISFLYDRFSRIEQSKRKVAELENNDLKRSVLKDLFRIYIKYDIIDLSDAEFDQFIDFCNLSDSFIQNASQYDLVMAIKKRYLEYEQLKK
jgi:hypothetical protein